MIRFPRGSDVRTPSAAQAGSITTWRKVMHTHSRTLLLTASAALAVFALPVAARAQMQGVRVADAREQAEKLEAEALTYEKNDWSNLKKAAGLREKAAELRSA